MSAVEKTAFEKELLIDESLAEKVNEARATDQAIHFACLADLKKTVGQDIKKIKYTSHWRNLTYWFIGSVILIGTSTALFVFSSDTQEEVRVTSENKEISTVEANRNEKSNPKEKESSSAQKKNQPSAILYSDNSEMDKSERIKQLDSTEKTLPEYTGSQNNTNEQTNLSLINKENEPRIIEESKSSDIKNNCNKEFDIRISASCKDKETGSIIISADEGIEFSFQVGHLKTYGPTGVFQNLPPGDYKILVTYHKECTFTKTVKVEENWCPLNQPFSFNPDFNEKWEIKYDEGATGKFIVYDRTGKEIYKDTFGAGNEHWSGTDTNGNAVPIGTYAAILYYSDGRIEKVDLTIVR